MSTSIPPLDRGLLNPLSQLSLLLLTLSTVYEMRIRTRQCNLDTQLNVILENKAFAEYPGLAVRTHYTGIPIVDSAASFFVVVFLPGSAPFREEYGVLQAYFLNSFLALVVIFWIEACRVGSKGSLIRWTSIFGTLYQTIGGAIITPLWFLFFLRHSSHSRGQNYYSPSSIRIPKSYARSLLPAMILGYLLPTLAMYAPFNDRGLRLKQAFVAFWQAHPLFINILLLIFSTLFSSSSSSHDTTTNRNNDDMKFLTPVYALSFTASLSFHLFFLYTWLTQSQWSLAAVFIPDPAALNNMSQCFHYIFQVDYLFIFLTALIPAFVVVRDLELLRPKRSSASQSWIVVVGGMLVGSVLCGPAAVVAGLWWWREIKMQEYVFGVGGASALKRAA